MKNQSETVRVLNRLIQVCQEGEKTFRNAAQSAGRSELRRLFQACAQQRQRFAAELKAQARLRSPNPWQSASMEDPKPRPNGFESTQWSDMEALQASLRGAAQADESYREALAGELLSGTRFVIEAQHALLRQTHEQLLALSGATSPNHEKQPAAVSSVAVEFPQTRSVDEAWTVPVLHQPVASPALAKPVNGENGDSRAGGLFRRILGKFSRQAGLYTG